MLKVLLRTKKICLKYLSDCTRNPQEKKMVQPAAAAQAGIAQALQQDTIIKKSTNLPWYYGMPLKENISATDLIDWLEAAAGIAGWDTVDKMIRELYLLFRDEAIVWWK